MFEREPVIGTMSAQVARILGTRIVGALLAVTMAVQAVGTLLLFALLVTPAATGITLTPRPSLAMAISAVTSVGSVWVGLAASAMFNVPPSFLVVTVACGIWLVVWLVRTAC